MNNSHGNYAGSKCSLFDSNVKCDAITGIGRAVAIVSLISCLYIVIVIVILKRYQFQPQRLILYVSIAEFTEILFYAWTDYPPHHFDRDSGPGRFCIFEGWYQIFTAWIIMMLLCVITFTIAMITVKRKLLGWKAEIVYAFVVLVPATIASLLPLSKQAYGPAEIYCWITVKMQNGHTYGPGVGFQFGVFYGPWIVLSPSMAVVLFFVIAVVKYRLKNAGSTPGDRDDDGPLVDTTRNLWKKEIKLLMPYPFIYIAALILPMINRLRIAAEFHDNPESRLHFAIWFFHAFCFPLPGFLFAIAFTCGKSTRTDLRRKFLWCWRRIFKRDYMEVQEGNERARTSTYGASTVSPPR